MPIARQCRAVLMMMLLMGCEPTQLYLVNHTVVGISAAVNPEQTTGTLLLGYDRTFATVIPRSVDRTGATQSRDAMSALVCSNLAVEGITIRKYTESLATGEAATKFAAKLSSDSKNEGDAKAENLKDFFDCFKGRKENPSPGPGTRP
jgi:hypothetical protein